MREYRIAKGWAIFIYVAAPLLIGLFAWLLIMPFVPGMKGEITPSAYWFLAPMSIGMIGLMTVGLIDTIKGKFVIDIDKIYTVSTFSSRQLKFEEIKGYTVTDKYIFVESNNHKKKIKISTYIGKSSEIVQWLVAHYPDLDVENAKQEEKEILSNEDFGWTTEQREEELRKARRTSTILNWTGGVVGAWTLFFPNPYEYIIIASLIVPIISIVALKLSKGLIRMDQRKGSAYPTIFWAVLASCSGLCLRGIVDFNVLEYDNVWAPSIIIALTLIFLLLLGNKEFKFKQAKDYISILVISLFLLGYGYGAVVTMNCFYDKSKPEVYAAKILNKRISSGKTTSYYIELTPWGQRKESEEVSVSKKMYDRLQKDNDVTIYLKKGKFEIPWFIVTE